MHASRERESMVVNCEPIWWQAALGSFTTDQAAFYTVGGEKALRGGGGSHPPAPAVLDGSIHLSGSPWTGPFSCLSCRCCRVRHEKAHVLSKPGKKESFYGTLYLEWTGRCWRLHFREVHLQLWFEGRIMDRWRLIFFSVCKIVNEPKHLHTLYVFLSTEHSYKKF